MEKEILTQLSTIKIMILGLSIQTLLLCIISEKRK